MDEFNQQCELAAVMLWRAGVKGPRWLQIVNAPGITPSRIAEVVEYAQSRHLENPGAWISSALLEEWDIPTTKPSAVIGMPDSAEEMFEFVKQKGKEASDG